MLFRKIEFLIEGSAEQQLRRNRGPWTRERMVRQGVKVGVFFGLSFLIANTFLAYVIGSDALWNIVTDSPPPCGGTYRHHDLHGGLLPRLRALSRAGLHLGVSLRACDVVDHRPADDHGHVRQPVRGEPRHVVLRAATIRNTSERATASTAISA